VLDLLSLGISLCNYTSKELLTCKEIFVQDQPQLFKNFISLKKVEALGSGLLDIELEFCLNIICFS